MNNLIENDDDVERLQPTPTTLRRLYSLSGNLCSYNFNGEVCGNLLFDKGGQFIGEVCHIEAANKKGQRFNPYMTNEQRRDFNNLILLCRNHHKITDDVLTYPVDTLKRMKALHESKFSSDILIERMLDGLKDYTKGNSFVSVNNLNNLFSVINPNDNYGRTVEMVEDDVEAFNLSIKKYLTLSPYSRKIFLLGLERSHHPYRFWRLDEDTLYVDFTEVCRILGLFNNDPQVWAAVSEIEAHGLMHRTEVEISENNEVIRNVYTKISPIDDYDVSIWLLIKKYCYLSNYDLVQYIERLDFSDLDN